MNIFNGCLKRLTKEEEQSNRFTSLPGCTVFNEWHPFYYLAFILDYKDMIENTASILGCWFAVRGDRFILDADPNYVIKIVELPKFSMPNLSIFSVALEDAVKAINMISTEYLDMYNEIKKELA